MKIKDSRLRGRILNRMAEHERLGLLTKDQMVVLLIDLYEVSGNVIPMETLAQMDRDREAAA